LQQYDWPGNVRELRHAVERAVILGEEDVFCVDDFPLRPGAGSSVTDNRLDAGLNLEALEEHAIRQAMKREGGNVSRAARALGISRASLYRRMEKYGL
jgi:transcriptional regulator with PAS, ATPase and Fis domain